jgi:hypothetical protein
MAAVQRVSIMSPMQKGQKQENTQYMKRMETELGKLARDNGLCVDKPDTALMNVLLETFKRGVRRGRDEEKKRVIDCASDETTSVPRGTTR